MIKRISLFVSFALLLTLIALPVQAADQVINLIDESGASWEEKDANDNSVTVNFNGGSLIATAPGAWPNVTATFNEPITLNADDNATIYLKFKVEDDNAATSIRLISDTQYIYLHHFVDDALYDGSGDIKAGEYELSAKLFDLKAFDGSEDNEWLGKKDLTTDGSGNITFDKFQVWCAGASNDITVTIEKLEITIPDTGSDESDEESSEEDESDSSDSSEASQESSSAQESETSEKSETPPQTGDMGLAGIIVLAIISISVIAVIALKKRS